MTSKLQEVIIDWHNKQQRLKELKAEEMKLRKSICADLLAGKILPAKTTLILGELEVIAKNDLSYSVDSPVLEALWPELSDEEKKAIIYKPNLVMKIYKTLSEDSLIQEAITSKPSAPTLKVK